MGFNYNGEIFQFKCLACDLEFKFEVKEKESKSSKAMFYCKQCNLVTENHVCENCKNNLKRIIYTIKGQTIPIKFQEEGFSVSCPQCHSDNTILIPLNKWIMDYQVW